MAKPKLDVLFEDNHLIIVNKPAGELSQGDVTGDSPFSDEVKKYIKEKYQKPGDVFLGTVHRLDRPVSGLMVFARTSKGLEKMSELFRERRVKKTYWAVVKTKPKEKEGKLVNWLVKDSRINKVAVYDEPVENSQKAELKYRLLGKLNLHYLLEVCPLTGRPHQIRAQLAHIGCPIRGDIKYGYYKANSDGNINLHSRRIDFIHPVKNEPVICVAGLPPSSFWEEFLTLEDLNITDKNLNFLH